MPRKPKTKVVPVELPEIASDPDDRPPAWEDRVDDDSETTQPTPASETVDEPSVPTKRGRGRPLDKNSDEYRRLMENLRRGREVAKAKREEKKRLEEQEKQRVEAMRQAVREKEVVRQTKREVKQVFKKHPPVVVAFQPSAVENGFSRQRQADREEEDDEPLEAPASIRSAPAPPVRQASAVEDGFSRQRQAPVPPSVRQVQAPVRQQSATVRQVQPVIMSAGTPMTTRALLRSIGF
jgi:hypothetical protein